MLKLKNSGLRIFLILLFCWNFGASQSPFKYIWPIDTPFVITGNYGELRPNHFHAGIDFSTSGKVNLPIYSIEEGYVSRIRMSPYGYGKCIYITHPNGKVSVYAHLNSFSLKIAAKAKEYQYKVQSFEVDFMPKPRSIYVRKNEIIGLSGNTGGSTGPHLHFEIRDEVSEVPLNPLGFYRLKDKSAPEVNSIAFYNLADTSAPAFLNIKQVRSGTGDSMTLEDDHMELNQSIIGLAFSGLDRIYPRGNPNNIFSVRVFYDETLIYSHQLNNIAFADSRFINEFSDSRARTKYQKCFLPTAYPTGLFGKGFNKGRIVLKDTSYHKIRFEFADESGNTSKLKFFLKTNSLNSFKKSPEEGDVYVNCLKDFSISENKVKLIIPAKTLFYSKNISIENTLELNNKISILPELKLNQAVSLGFKVPPAMAARKEKLVLKKGSSTVIGTYRNDSVYFALKDFGVFTLVSDTTAPKIKVESSPKQIKQSWLMDYFSFKISDNLSGIGKYNVWLNDAWVLAEYDAKTDLLTYYFDDETPMGLLQFKVEVEDKLGNKSRLEYVLKK